MKRKAIDDNYGAGKRQRRMSMAKEKSFLVKGGFDSSAAERRVYVPRTPGGQIVADHHYFDFEKGSAAIKVGTTDWTDTELDGQTGGGPLELLCLFAPTQGDDISQRTGRKTFLKKIRLHGTISVASQNLQNALDQPAKVRLILYCDQQTNASQSQGEQIITSGNAAGPINMFQNPANFGRFKVYKDKVYVLNPQTATNDTGATGGVLQGGAKRDFKFNVTVNKWVNYNGTNGGTVADIVDNSFHLIGITDGSSLAPTIVYKGRCTFLP